MFQKLIISYDLLIIWVITVIKKFFIIRSTAETVSALLCNNITFVLNGFSSPGFMTNSQRCRGGERRSKEKQSIDLTDWMPNSTTKYDTQLFSPSPQNESENLPDLLSKWIKDSWWRDVLLCLSENHQSCPGQKNSVAVSKRTGGTFYWRLNQWCENILKFYQQKTT